MRGEDGETGNSGCNRREGMTELEEELLKEPRRVLRSVRKGESSRQVWEWLLEWIEVS